LQKKYLLNAFIFFIILTIVNSTTILIPSIAKAQLPTERFVASTGYDNGNCTNINAPCQTIQYAINQSLSGNVIYVASGRYKYKQSIDPCPFLVENNIGKDGRAVACIVDKSLTILGGYTSDNWGTADPETNITIVDGENAYRGIFFIGYNSTTASLRMEGFTIENCQIRGPDSASDPSGLGGGMMVAGANVILRDLIFKNNIAWGKNTNSGAGGTAAGSGLNINWSRSGTTNLLERLVFENNLSFGGTGPIRGGLAFGALFVNANVSINDSSFYQNIATGGNSPGVGLSGGLNADSLGAAIGGGGGSWQLNNIIAFENQAIGGNAQTYGGGAFGGAIHVELAQSFSIIHSQINNNLAKAGSGINGGFGAGGGILVNSTPAMISSIELIGNSAQGGDGNSGHAGGGGGGGLYLWSTYSNPIPHSTITNSIIAENSVSMGPLGDSYFGGGGGGIQIQGLAATIEHTTIAANKLDSKLVSGQGLLVLSDRLAGPASVILKNSIVANHTVGKNGAVAILVQSSNTVNFEYGLLSGNTKDTNVDNSPLSAGNITGLSSMSQSASPEFISPGLPYQNYHIRLGSPAMNSALTSTIDFDFDEQNRPFMIHADFGADEYWPLPIMGFPCDGMATIFWAYGKPILRGGVNHYEIIVDCPPGSSPPDQGACGLPINTQLNIVFQLSGLSNFKEYVISIIAKDENGTIISVSEPLTITPTNIVVFLPYLAR